MLCCCLVACHVACPCAERLPLEHPACQLGVSMFTAFDPGFDKQAVRAKAINQKAAAAAAAAAAEKQ